MLLRRTLLITITSLLQPSSITAIVSSVNVLITPSIAVNPPFSTKTSIWRCVCGSIQQFFVVYCRLQQFMVVYVIFFIVYGSLLQFMVVYGSFVVYGSLQQFMVDGVWSKFYCLDLIHHVIVSQLLKLCLTYLIWKAARCQVAHTPTYFPLYC